MRPAGKTLRLMRSSNRLLSLMVVAAFAVSCGEEAGRRIPPAPDADASMASFDASAVLDADDTGDAPATELDALANAPDAADVGSRDAAPMCGNGHVEADEACDDGNAVDTDACRNNCDASRCGDGVQQSGEACDDGNRIDTDRCLNTCKVAMCGDAVVEAGKEECDDGNQIAIDGCLPDCKNARCGDQVVRTGIEACDDGNRINEDACTNECAVPGCGDGIKQGNEECDDGNRINEDACTNTCRNARCGDGAKQAGEACDDGNSNNNDACLADCTASRCVPLPNVDDGNACTTDSCDPFKGPVHAPIAARTLCPDDDVCDGINRCNGEGKCVPTAAVPVDNTNRCRIGRCDTKLGPVYDNANKGTTCADGNVCNGDEVCDGQGTCLPGTPAPQRTLCEDGNLCNGTSRCDGQGTCQSAGNRVAGTSCSTDNQCLVCNGQGVCEAPTAANLDDGNGCTVDTCDYREGAVHNRDTRLGMSCLTFCGDPCVPRPPANICLPRFCSGFYQCSNNAVTCEVAVIR